MAVAVLIAAACGNDDDPSAPLRIFPEDYAASYQQVRDCRRSSDHDLLYVRVLADPVALAPYQNRDVPFPEGSTLVKEEYVDDQCTDLERWTAMKREAPGYAPEGGDWHWQRIDKGGAVELDGTPQSCTGCHKGCQTPPDSHDWTCAVP